MNPEHTNTDYMLIAKQDLRDLMSQMRRDLISQMRQDVRKKICSTKEACYILDVHSNKFYELANKDTKSLIRPSKLTGKWVLQSIYDEADRLNGIKKATQ